MKRKVEAINEYYNEALGCMVKVYPEKQVKRRSWMRGETFIGISQRMFGRILGVTVIQIVLILILAYPIANLWKVLILGVLL